MAGGLWLGLQAPAVLSPGRVEGDGGQFRDPRRDRGSRRHRRRRGRRRTGRQLIERFRAVPASGSSRCAMWTRRSSHEVEPVRGPGRSGRSSPDFRRVLDEKNIDAVVIATPNHWHALATIWACQAGKDVYVEKPFSYNIWEGRQMVAAARKYGRMVQVGTQSRSSTVLRQAFELSRSGEIGPIRFAHAHRLSARAKASARSARRRRCRPRWITTCGAARPRRAR